MNYFGWNGLRPGRLFGALALVGNALFACSPAWAALGGDIASIVADRAHFQTSDKVTSHPLYDVHEMTISSGASVREYTAPDGTVFAIGWDGPAMPDLRQALGTHFEDFVAAARVNQGGHHYLAAQRGDLVLVSTGRMRAFAGHAYLASAVPPGVSIAELR
jgi:Protein of unknown function (DUF2844)